MPFCKQCGAPQIRVVGFESEPPAASTAVERSSDVLTPPALPTLPRPFPHARTGSVQWSQALPGAALGGIFSLLIPMIIPYAVLGPAFLVGGAMAVLFYRKASGGVSPGLGAGARIGAASGAFGFLYTAVVTVAIAVYRPGVIREVMANGVTQMTALGYPAEQVEKMRDFVNSPDSITAFLSFALFMMLLIMVVGSSIGGAFYAAWSRKRHLM